MKQEPVGYYYAKACIDIRDCSEQMKRNGIPLYTTPQLKELSDEEIDLTGKNNDGVLKLFYMIQGDITGLQFKEALRDFARAILKKARGE